MSQVQRMSILDVDENAFKAVYPLQKYVNSSSLEKRLITIVDIRASQVNSCAWCLDMHTQEAREAGVPQRKIDLVAAWAEAGALFSEREQAALALTEQITRISAQGVTDEVWDRVTKSFSDQETVELIMTISTINVWNRMNVAALTDLPEKSGE
jgi:AhpD family alkylhydroperoxidase